MRSSDSVFLTGCDDKCEWMLRWFFDNYLKTNNTPIVFADFGVTETTLDMISPIVHHVIDLKGSNEQGWFKKPRAMIECSRMFNKSCWIDTDCRVKGDISVIFDFTTPGKLAMGEDKPWSMRSGEKWYNSGIVAYEKSPKILMDWALKVYQTKNRGDQEVLHEIVSDPLKVLMYIEELPNKYNVMRVQHIDKTVPNEVLVEHWTGDKGKAHIRKLIGAIT